MSVFFCGIAMAHYNWYNLSASARLVTAQTFQSVSYACEMFVFCYMGFSVWTLSFEQTVGNKERSAKWSPALIVTAAFTTWIVWDNVDMCIRDSRHLLGRGGWHAHRTIAPGQWK